MKRVTPKAEFNQRFYAIPLLVLIFYSLVIVNNCCGAEGATFLNLTPGARAIGLGQSFVAIADDATACYYNPAGLAFVSQPQMLSMNLSPPIGLAKATLWGLTELSHPLFCQKVHSSLDPGDNYRYIYYAAVFPLVNNCHFGIDVNYYNYSIIEWFDTIPVHSFYPCYSLGLNYGRKFISNLGVGVSIKYIYENLPYDLGSTHSFAFGGGILFKSRMGFSFGASLSNLGPPIKYMETEAVLPLTARIGLAQSVTDFLMEINEQDNNLVQKLNQYFRFQFAIERKIDLAGEIRYHKTACGFEIKAFDILSYRQGFSLTKEPTHMWSYPKSLGVDLRIVEFDITITNSNFPEGSWWIQSKFKPLDNKPQFLQENKTLDHIFFNLSCLAIPGGGQLYNGDKWKAIPFLVTSFIVADVILEGNTNPSWQYDVYDVAIISLPILYLGSGIEAHLAKRSKDNK